MALNCHFAKNTNICMIGVISCVIKDIENEFNAKKLGNANIVISPAPLNLKDFRGFITCPITKSNHYYTI